MRGEDFFNKIDRQFSDSYGILIEAVEWGLGMHILNSSFQPRRIPLTMDRWAELRLRERPLLLIGTKGLRATVLADLHELRKISSNLRPPQELLWWLHRLTVHDMDSYCRSYLETKVNLEKDERDRISLLISEGVEQTALLDVALGSGDFDHVGNYFDAHKDYRARIPYETVWTWVIKNFPEEGARRLARARELEDELEFLLIYEESSAR